MAIVVTRKAVAPQDYEYETQDVYTNATRWYVEDNGLQLHNDNCADFGEDDTLMVEYPVGGWINVMRVPNSNLPSYYQSQDDDDDSEDVEDGE